MNVTDTPYQPFVPLEIHILKKAEIGFGYLFEECSKMLPYFAAEKISKT